MSMLRQFVNLLAGEAFHFRGARIRNSSGRPVRLEIEVDAYEIRKLRRKEQTTKESGVDRHAKS
jgi:hypothetical protein